MESDSRLNSEKEDVFRVAIVTNIVPHYRESFYKNLSKLDSFKFTVFCQDTIPGSGIDNIVDSLPLSVVKVPFIGFRGETIGFQLLPLSMLIRDFDVYLILGNPRILSNPAFSLLLRLMRRPVAIWGQAHTANSNSLSKKIRLIWWRQFHFIFLYNEHEVHQLRKNGFAKQQLAAMNNGLDQVQFDELTASYSESSLSHWKTQKNISNRRIILSCARLTSKNSFFEVVESLTEVRAQFPDVLWCIIGDGPEKDSLTKAIRERKLENHVMWIGSLFEEEQLAPWFLSSLVMVHPEGIGLSLLHAFGYGLPVITSNNPNAQMPEFYTLVDGLNGLLYERKNASSLADRICTLIGNETLRGRLAENALSTVRNSYNTTTMASNLHKLLNAMTPLKNRNRVTGSVDK